MRAFKIFVTGLACAALAVSASAATTKHHIKPGTGMASMAPPPPPAPAPAKPGCEYRYIVIPPDQREEFRNPDEIKYVERSNGTSELGATVTIGYTDATIAGCAVHLRTYNGKLVGPTLRVKPTTTMNVRLVNAIQPLTSNPCPMPGHSNTPGMGFDITNMHVHGLHVSPKNNSDNVFVQVCPPGTRGPQAFNYQFALGQNHSLQPPGTNWYHPHLHGSTALQVASGAEGALIVEGGQDNLPAIAAAKQQIMVLQEISYNDQGVIENYNNIGDWTTYKRAITVNGQVQPVIKMRPGEVQYWRMIDAGVSESMLLHVYDAAGNPVGLNEIATDGNALGHIDTWKEPSRPLDLEPGYRSDVLFKAPLQASESPTYYYLSTGPVKGLDRLQVQLPPPGDANSAALTEAVDEEDPPQLVAVIEVSGAARDMALPSNLDLKPFGEILTPVDRNNLPKEKIVFASGNRICDPANPAKPCTVKCNSGEPNCANRFMVNDIPYTDKVKIVQHLDTSAEWDVYSNNGQHPFHIHVNPFQMDRIGPDGNPETIWKDTILVKSTDHPPTGEPMRLYTRYDDFDGEFVMHCHILNHEDKGMMMNVEIVK
jgi:FtsP/CotA-like multicopper oxidase with cupredoxin domain